MEQPTDNGGKNGGISTAGIIAIVISTVAVICVVIIASFTTLVIL